jgi:threonine dehydrogenase-like Zn-dependent dehydrogenase
MMKAAIVERPGVLTVRDIPQPEMGEYDALCRLLYGATCTGTDGHLIAGRFPWPVTYPTVLGHESIGRVVAVGAKVRSYRVGDLVTRVGTPASPAGDFHVNWGGFAEYGIARDHWAMQEDGRPPEEWRGYRWNQVLPPDFDPGASTMIITWRETLSYLTRMGFGSGASLLVIGSGGNGLSFAAHGANLGARRVAMIGSPVRAQTAQAAGVNSYFDYRSGDLEAEVSSVCPDGFDFIVDAVGRRASLDSALSCLKPGGTVGIYGIDEYGTWQLRPGRARGSFTFSVKGYDEAETHERVVAFVREGKLDARLWLDLDHPFQLADITEAFEALARRETVKALIRLAS